jgi:hypothetical protein
VKDAVPINTTMGVSATATAATTTIATTALPTPSSLSKAVTASTTSRSLNCSQSFGPDLVGCSLSTFIVVCSIVCLHIFQNQRCLVRHKLRWFYCGRNGRSDNCNLTTQTFPDIVIAANQNIM